MQTKICCGCGLEWPLEEFFHNRNYPDGHRYECKTCNKADVIKYKQKNRAKITAYERERMHRKGNCRSMEEARDSTVFLGVYVAETVLSEFFDHMERMSYGNPGYDFICGRGYKVDVKSSCMMFSRTAKNGCWKFDIDKNSIADYFLCIAFDDRTNLNPLHVWLIPGSLVNGKWALGISNSDGPLQKWSKFECPLDRVTPGCEALRRG